MKILWLSNIPAPYRVDFFNELGKDCQLTVLFERAFSSERDIGWQGSEYTNFKNVILNGIKFDKDKALCLSVIKWLNKGNYDLVIISNPLTPTGIIAIEFLRIIKTPFIIEGDGGFPKSGKGIIEAIKKHLIKSASSWFSTGHTHTNYYLQYGARLDKIVQYPFTSIREADILPKIINTEEKKVYKSKLGISENLAILSVGRFIYSKGFDVLIKAGNDIVRNCGIYIIGGVPTVEYLDLCKKYPQANVHFLEFKNKESLFMYYKACDLFVLPTRSDVWGLVINEAMASGLPVITTDKCIAGMELIVDYENGFIVPVDNSNLLADRINTILENDDLRHRVSVNNLNKIKSYTIENMARVHLEIFERLI